MAGNPKESKIEELKPETAGSADKTDGLPVPGGKLKLTESQSENNVGETSSVSSAEDKTEKIKPMQNKASPAKVETQNTGLGFKLPQLPIGKGARTKHGHGGLSDLKLKLNQQIKQKSLDSGLARNATNSISKDTDKSGSGEDNVKEGEKAVLEKKTASSRTRTDVAEDSFVPPKLPVKQSKLRTEEAADVSSSNEEEKKQVLDDMEDTENSDTSTSLTSTEKVLATKEKSLSSSKLSPAEKLAKTAPLPYKEPTWSGLPAKPYQLEVLKGGAILSRIPLNEKPFIVFGRLESCDVMLEHPSLSRYHMVLQYRTVGDSDCDPGFYVYDLDSTHGSFLNKQKIKPKRYCRMHVGHMFKLAGSTRLYILQGPEEDEEAESELSVTELKQLREKQLMELEKRKVQKKEEEEEQQRQEEEQKGISWGMDDDAEEEDPSEENPFSSMTQEERESLYIKDPKKTLRGFFEREGYELEYDVEEKNTGHGRQFICRVELPVDDAEGRPITAEVAVSGKKKEAVVACALESCRILDAHGVLRQAKHESKKKKAKNWADDDYYDSDDDTFLDRTGEIEKKREARMKKAGVIKEEVETFASLTVKLGKVESEMNQIDTDLESLKQTSEQASADDSLEAFMSSIKSGAAVDKSRRAKLKIRKIELRKDQARLMKLINIARPAALPKIKRQSVPTKEGSCSSSTSTKQLPMIGSLKSRLGAKNFRFVMPPAVKPVAQHTISSTTQDVVEEEEEDDEDDDDKVVPMETSATEEKKREKSKDVRGASDDNGNVSSSADGDKRRSSSDDEQTEKHDSSVKGPTLPSSHSIKGPSLPSSRSTKGPYRPPSGRLVKGPSLPPVIKGPTLPSDFGGLQKGPSKREYDEQGEEEEDTPEKKKPTQKRTMETEEDVTDWVPPKGQTGDGRTALNEKFGY